MFPGTVSARQCSASGAGISGGLAGANLSFTVQAADQYGNAITSGTYLFSASISPAVSSGLTLTASAAGVATGSYSITQAGTYTLTLALNGTTINGGQTYSIVIGPGEQTAHSATRMFPYCTFKLFHC